MRSFAMCLVLAAAAAGAGCLRTTEFRCRLDTDCGTSGTCEAVGYCSVQNADCAGTGRSYSDSAGQGLANTCLPGGGMPGVDAGIDGSVPIDGQMVGCPGGYNAVAGSAHRYKVLTNVTWDTAASDCKLTSAAAYLAVPDDATELANLATAAVGTPFWIGIDDKTVTGTFKTQKGVTATVLPWATGEPDLGPPPKQCVKAISATEIATDKCGTAYLAVCECEP